MLSHHRLHLVHSRLSSHHSKDPGLLRRVRTAMAETSRQPWRCHWCRRLNKHHAATCGSCYMSWEKCIDIHYTHGQLSRMHQPDKHRERRATRRTGTNGVIGSHPQDVKVLMEDNRLLPRDGSHEERLQRSAWTKPRVMERQHWNRRGNLHRRLQRLLNPMQLRPTWMQQKDVFYKNWFRPWRHRIDPCQQRSRP